MPTGIPYMPPPFLPCWKSTKRDKEKQDRIEQESIDFHNRVFNGYEELELQFPDRIVGIDANQEIGEIREEILYHIERHLER